MRRILKVTIQNDSGGGTRAGWNSDMGILARERAKLLEVRGAGHRVGRVSSWDEGQGKRAHVSDEGYWAPVERDARKGSRLMFDRGGLTSKHTHAATFRQVRLRHLPGYLREMDGAVDEVQWVPDSSWTLAPKYQFALLSRREVRGLVGLHRSENLSRHGPWTPGVASERRNAYRGGSRRMAAVLPSPCFTAKSGTRGSRFPGDRCTLSSKSGPCSPCPN